MRIVHLGSHKYTAHCSIKLRCTPQSLMVLHPSNHPSTFTSSCSQPAKGLGGLHARAILMCDLPLQHSHIGIHGPGHSSSGSGLGRQKENNYAGNDITPYTN